MLSQEDIVRARRVNLVSYLTTKGFCLKHDGGGNYKVDGHSGVVVKRNYYSNLVTGKGGNALDFATRELGLPFREAVSDLIGVTTEPSPVPSVSSETGIAKNTEKCHVPRRGDPRKMVKYLVEERRLPIGEVAKLMRDDLVYADEQGNCVFPCRDMSGTVRAVAIRSVGTSKKGMSRGSDASHGWYYSSSPDPGPIVCVTESVIDTISMVAQNELAKSGFVLSLNGCGQWNALERFLGVHPQVKVVVLGLDNDEAGRKATDDYRLRLTDMGYEVWDERPPQGYKDWNEALLSDR